ncbi:McrB family protein [Geodermatophilus sp. SYSU D01105]
MASELDRCYTQRPNLTSGADFLTKLRAQLADAEPEAKLLFAELLYLNLLPLANVGGSRKRQVVNTVLSWLPEPISIPPHLDAPLDKGVFNGGVGGNTYRWAALVYLINIVREWWTKSDADRQHALSDPWAFKGFLESVKAKAAANQRHALKYLAFPEVFQPIVSTNDRAKIRDAYKYILGRPPGDIDRDLLEIRDKLQKQSPDVVVDFYLPPWSAAWVTTTAVSAGAHAWLVRPPASADRDAVVEQWLVKGDISLPAAGLEDVSPGASISAIREAVSATYSGMEYVSQLQLSNDVHAILSRMRSGDIVAALSSEGLRLGRLGKSGPGFNEDDPSRELRRAVQWFTSLEPIPIADLPDPLSAHLDTPGAVVDLSEDYAVLAELIGEGSAADDGSAEIDTPSARVTVADEMPRLQEASKDLADRLLIDVEHLQEWINLLQDRQQVIFYGPPGTGKTYLAERLARYLADAERGESERVRLVQFHPSTSYEDFVEGFRPAGGNGGQISFQLTPGPLSRVAAAARTDPGHPYFLIIDEINRGNLAKIFGELYYLLEYRDRGINLLYRPDKPFTLPRNLFLIGTMNTADRSIALVDAAMRRRFAFVELHPDGEPVRSLLPRWLEREGWPAERADLLRALNERLDERDFKVGPSYLMKADADRPEGLQRVWRYSILPLLVEQYYGRLSPDEIEKQFGLEALRRAVRVVPAEVAVPDNTATGTEARVDGSGSQ